MIALKSTCIEVLLILQFLFNSFSGQLGERITLVTRSDDTTFSSFVNAVVTATINAVHDGITRQNSNGMPQIYLFGDQLIHMFRDVIRFSGNYDDIYLESHVIDGEEDNVDRGYNEIMTVQTMIEMYWGPDLVKVLSG